MNIILLNGKHQCGKDSFAETIAIPGSGIETLKFADPLVKIACAMFSIKRWEWDSRYALNKDKRWDRTDQMSQRELLIWIAEDCVKPRLGKGFFGRRAAKAIRALDKRKHTVILTDAGFYPEIETFLKYFKDEEHSVSLVNIHREAAGLIDSRQALDGAKLGIPSYILINESPDVEHYHGVCRRLFNKIKHDMQNGVK